MKKRWFDAVYTITYRRQIQAETATEAKDVLVCDYCDDDIELAECEAEEIVREFEKASEGAIATTRSFGNE